MSHITRLNSSRANASEPRMAVRPVQFWSRPGKIRPAILLWALGVPIPLILLVFLLRGCM
ncbi:MAG: hypothetical protein NTV94_07350 [Planctomycetota bacterium]|nr:hypothetical protein [Planctomycetota bacterium]